MVGLWSLWLAQASILEKLGYPWSVQTLGPWGDTFGALSSLFSALGFIAVVATLRMQQGQIQQARNDQEKINIETREEQHRQRFDGSFFELLKLLREAKEDVVFHHTSDYDAANLLRDQKFVGIDAFRAAWREVSSNFYAKKPTPTRLEAGRIYNDIVHKRFESRFGPYFRLLYTILNRINSDNILTAEDKIRYANLLRSQLTSYELILIGLNGLSPVSGNLSDLVSEFRLFKYATPGPRLRLLKKFYPKEAFEPRD